MIPLNQPNGPLAQPSAFDDKTNKRGRVVGSSNLNSNQHTSISLAFKRVGLDWRENMAKAILADDKKRIAMWMKLLPYLVSRNHKSKGKRWKGKASKAVLIALDQLEQE
jgi:hypothetical protein